MSYKKCFNVDENGVGHTITGIPCEIYESEEEGILYLTLHYGADLEASLIAPMDKDIGYLLMELILFVPVRPRRPSEEPSLSKVVGGIIEAMHTEGLKDISIRGLTSSPYVKVIALSDKANYGISYSESEAKCRFSTWSADSNTVSLEFSRALNISFGQFKDCFE